MSESTVVRTEEFKSIVCALHHRTLPEVSGCAEIFDLFTKTPRVLTFKEVLGMAQDAQRRGMEKFDFTREDVIEKSEPLRELIKLQSTPVVILIIRVLVQFQFPIVYDVLPWLKDTVIELSPTLHEARKIDHSEVVEILKHHEY